MKKTLCLHDRLVNNFSVQDQYLASSLLQPAWQSECVNPSLKKHQHKEEKNISLAKTALPMKAAVKREFPVTDILPHKMNRFSNYIIWYLSKTPSQNKAHHMLYLKIV